MWTIRVYTAYLWIKVTYFTYLIAVLANYGLCTFSFNQSFLDSVVLRFRLFSFSTGIHQQAKPFIMHMDIPTHQHHIYHFYTMAHYQSKLWVLNIHTSSSCHVKTFYHFVIALLHRIRSKSEVAWLKERRRAEGKGWYRWSWMCVLCAKCDIYVKHLNLFFIFIFMYCISYYSCIWA